MIDLLEDLNIFLSHFNFVMVYMIHKMLVLIKNSLNYLQDSVFKCFLNEYF